MGRYVSKLILLISLVFLSATFSWGQTAQDALRLFKEAHELQKKAKFKADLEKTLQKYEQALSVCRKVGEKNGEAACLNEIGVVHNSLGQYSKALEYFEKSLEIRRKIGDVPDEGITLNNIGGVYWSWGQYSKALEYNEKALAIHKRVGNAKQEGTTLNNIGLVYNSLGQYSKALEYFEKSLEIRRKIGDVQGEGGSLNNIASVYKSWGQYAKALEYYEKSLEITQKLGHVQGEGVVLNNIGGIYHFWGQYSKALEYYEKSLEITKKIGDVKQEGHTLNSIGGVYWSLGQYAKALEYHEKSMEIRRKIGDVQGEGDSLNNIASVYKSWGQYAKALEYYEKSMEIRRKIGDGKGEGVTLNNIGGIYHSWGQYPKALEYFEEALPIFKKIGDVTNEGCSLNNIASVYHSWGQYAKALEYYEKSRSIISKLGDVKSEGVTLNNMAYVNVAMGKHDQALADLRKTLDIYTGIKIPTGGVKDAIGEAYLEMGEIAKAEPFIKEVGYNSSLGWLALLKSDFKEARTHYSNLLNKAVENRDANGLFTAYTGLGKVHEYVGEYPKAEEYYRKAANGVEDIRSGLAPSERGNFFSVKTNGFLRTDPYEGLARVLARMNRTVEALHQSEYTKARVFAEALLKRMDSTRIPVPRDILEKDSSLNDQLDAVTKNLQQAYEKGNKEVIASLEPQVKEMRAKLGDHVDMLRKQFPLFAATKYPQPMDLNQTALNDDEWCLVYDVTDSGLLIYLTKGKTLVKCLFKPVTKKELQDLVRKVRDPLDVVPGRDKVSDKLKAFDFTAAKSLSDLLLADILPDLPKGASVVIVPNDCLGIVPFEMLALNPGGEIKTDRQVPYTSGVEFFGDRNPVSYYQSITALTLARTLVKQKQSQDKLLVIADPVFEMKDARAQEKRSSTKLTGSEARLYEDLMATVEEGKVGGLRFNRLPLTGDLAENLSISFKGSCTLYTGLKANKDTFMKEVVPGLGDYSKVIFATHGYFGKGLPGINEPVLVFTLVPPGTDGYLRMSEVMGLRMNTDMVALTACQTGLGKELSGEGVMGMGRAFQFAGAKSVLMSLWSVSEKSSTTMIESFFQNLKEGKGKLESLRLARQAIRDQGYDHPFFWAGFILVGEVN